MTKLIFRHTDLIGEGEYWVGGLISFCIIVLVCFSYSFSNQYYNQYPIEESSDSYFACDLTMRNAKFDTNLQSLAIPVDHEEQEMFDLLNEQSFIVQFDFINTLIRCDAISLNALYRTTGMTIRYIYCNSASSLLTRTVARP